MEKIQGKLTMSNLCFSSFDFMQKTDQKGTFDVEFSFNVVYKKITDKSNLVKLTVKILGENNRLSLNVTEQAQFELINAELLDENTRELLLTQNSVAIMFPYLRSQVAIITAQPGLTSIQLPIINVTELIKSATYED